MQLSGKWVITGIVTLALAAAGASWWFRYMATNQAARYWGAKNVQLIRDAPIVEFYRWGLYPKSLSDLFHEGNGRDISQTPGLLHLRSALLEDRSYRWPPTDVIPGTWGWVLVFREAQADRAAIILITSDWKLIGTPEQNSLWCEPISEGLAEFLGDFFPDPTRRQR